MSPVPPARKIFHITHIDNLQRILSDGKIWSDAKRIELGIDCRVVGMSEIKRRRLEEIEVSCHPRTLVGQYAPFYFCPRSIMLYILFTRNHPDITYRDGQEPMVHLVADLDRTIQWAAMEGVRWAFSDRNASNRLAKFFKQQDHLNRINWTAVNARDFRDVIVKEGKQAEFLVFESFPWELIENIGVHDDSCASRVATVLGSRSTPRVEVHREWYY